MTDKNNKLAKARAAMEGDRHKTTRVAESAALKKRRVEARLAMEGQKHKEARQAKEQAAKELAANKLKLIEDREKAEIAARLAEREKEQAARKAEQTELAEQSARAAKVRFSEQAIESLTKEEAVDLTPIRTFKGDLASLTKGKDFSLENVVIQEKERNRGTTKPEGRPANLNFKALRWWLALGGGVLLIIIIAGAVYALWPSQDNQNLIRPLTATSIIIPNDRREINLTGLSVERLTAALEQQHALLPSAEESITQIFFTQGSGNGRTVVSFDSLAQATALDLPLAFTRSLGPDFMLGLYRGQEPAGFYLFTTNAPEALRGAMRENEKRVLTELFRPFAGRAIIAQIDTARVRDGILSNTDVRILSDARGRTVLVYGLIAGNLMAITENETAFNKLFRLYRP